MTASSGSPPSASLLRAGRQSVFWASLLASSACGPDGSVQAGEEPIACELFFEGTGPDGAELVLGAPPARILPANLHAAELVLALVPRARLAGVPGTAFEFGAGFGTRAEWGEARILGRYRGEDVLALAPDLVVSGAYQDLETTALLRREGIPVLGLTTVRSFQDVLDGLAILGRLLEAEEQSHALVRSLEQRRAALAVRAEARTRKHGALRGLVYTNYGTGGWTQGSASPAEILLTLAGLQNAAASGGLEGHYQIDTERLLTLEPDVIVCGTEVSEMGASAQVLRGDPVLGHLRAVKEERLIVLPADLFQASSQRVVDAGEALADALDRLYP